MPSPERTVTLTGPTKLPRSLSPTSAGTWQQCELKYTLTYACGWQEPSTTPQLIGNVVHRAAELLYALDRADRTRPAASALLETALAEELERPAYGTLLLEGDPRAQVTDAGEDALDGLFEVEDPTTITVGPEGLEVWVTAELYGAPIRGRIDRIYDASGAQVVADYKTGKVPASRYTEKAFFGLWTYAAALAASDTEHRLADRIELLYLAGRERLSRPVLREVALEQAKTLARIWRSIQKKLGDSTVIARRSRLCDWCAFKTACPAFGVVPAIGSPGHDAMLISLNLSRPGSESVAIATERLAQVEPTEEP